MSAFLQQIVNGLVLGGVYAVFALGFSLVMANLRVFYVAHAAVFTWGAIFAWQLIEWGWAAYPALAAAVVLTGLLNVVGYYVLIRPLENRKNKELAAFMSSVGGLIVLTDLGAMHLQQTSVRLPFGLVPAHTWEFKGVQLSSIYLIMLVAATVIFLFLQWLMERTAMGRAIRAVAFDRSLAGMLGIRVDRVTAFVFVLSGALAAVAAILVAIAFNVVNSTMGSSYMTLAIAVLVIGGFGSVKGAFLGRLFVGLVSTLSIGYISSGFSDVIVYGTLIIFLLVRPTGIVRVADILGRA